MAKLGVLFEIDELDGGLYGYKAYKILFQAVPAQQLAGCVLSDGDTNATLQGRANQYCIAIESADGFQIAAIKAALAKSEAKGLVTLAARFMNHDEVQREPLVSAGYVSADGGIVGDNTGWVTRASQDIYKQPTTANLKTTNVSEKDIGDNAEPVVPMLAGEIGQVPASSTQAGAPPTESLPNPRVKTKRWRMWLILTVVVLALLAGIYFATRDASSLGTVSSIFPFLATATPTPGIGVTVRGSAWQVLVKQVRQDKTVKVGSGFSAKSWTAKEDYAFLIVDASFQRLTAMRNAVGGIQINASPTPTADLFSDENSIQSDQVALVAEDGAILTPAGALFANGEMGEICGGCSMTLMSGSGALDLNLVYLLKQNAITGKKFKLQFLDVPLIPFTAD